MKLELALKFDTLIQLILYLGIGKITNANKVTVEEIRRSVRAHEI